MPEDDVEIVPADNGGRQGTTRSRPTGFVYAHKGPLPPPQQLGQYENVLPGAAERIFAMAERNQELRLELSRNEQAAMIEIAQRHSKWEPIRSFSGLVAGFLVVMAVVGAGTFLIINGHDQAGGILIGIQLVGLASVFVLGRTDLLGRTRKDGSPDQPDGPEKPDSQS